MKYFLFCYFIVDASKDMQGEKIGVLNNSIQSVIPDLIDLKENYAETAEIYIRTMAYNDSAIWMDDKPIPVEDYVWNDITAFGERNASNMIKLLREELSRFKIYKKNILIMPILFSSGRANDDYRNAMFELMSLPIMRRGIRIGIPLGLEADNDLLLLFTGTKELILQYNNLHWILHRIGWEGDEAWYDEDWAENATFEDVYDSKTYYGEEKSQLGYEKCVRDCESDSQLSQILRICPEVLSDRRKLKAYLMDFIPEDKRLRNVICLCYDEGIPLEIDRKGEITYTEIQRYIKRLVDAYAMDKEISKKVIGMYITALVENNRITYDDYKLPEIAPLKDTGEYGDNTEVLNKSFWDRYSFVNVERIACSKMLIMDTGKYCIVESFEVEGPSYIFCKEVFLDKIQYWLETHNSNEARRKLWNFKYLAKRVFRANDKNNPLRMDKYLIDNGIANHRL